MGRTGKNNAYRFMAENVPVFAGEVERGRKYVVCDDVVNTGASVNALRCYIERRGGVVVAVCALCAQRLGDDYRMMTGVSDILPEAIFTGVL